MEKGDKIKRILDIYTKLLSGSLINKKESAIYYNVNERSIQRDIEDIRIFLAEGATKESFTNTIIYDTKEKSYKLININENKFTLIEALEVVKILFYSRAFKKEDLKEILNKILFHCTKTDIKHELQNYTERYLFVYKEPKLKFSYTHTFNKIVEAICNKNYIKLEYIDKNNKTIIANKLKPTTISFKNHHFYLTGFLGEDENRNFVSVYRLDRIEKLKILPDKFELKFSKDIDDETYIDSLQFMEDGIFQKISFQYIGENLDDILEIFPVAKIEKNKNVYTIQIDTFGDAAIKWLNNKEGVLNIEKIPKI